MSDTTRRLAAAAAPLMTSDRLKYDQAAREDVLRLCEVARHLGDRDVSSLDDEQLAAKVAELAGP